MKNEQSKYFISSPTDFEILEKKLNNYEYIHGNKPGLQDNLFYYQFFTTVTEPCNDLYPHVWKWYERIKNFDEKTIECWKSITEDDSKEVLMSLNSKIDNIEKTDKSSKINSKTDENIKFNKTPKFNKNNVLNKDDNGKIIGLLPNDNDDFDEYDDIFNDKLEKEVQLEIEKQKAITKKKMQMQEMISLKGNHLKIKEKIILDSKPTIAPNQSIYNPYPNYIDKTDKTDVFYPDPEAKKKVKKKKFESMLVIEISYLLKIDLNTFANEIKQQIIKPGLTWKEHKTDPLSLTTKNLRILCVIDDDLIETDDLIDEMKTRWKDKIQNISIISHENLGSSFK